MKILVPLWPVFTLRSLEMWVVAAVSGREEVSGGELGRSPAVCRSSFWLHRLQSIAVLLMTLKYLTASAIEGTSGQASKRTDGSVPIVFVSASSSPRPSRS